MYHCFFQGKSLVGHEGEVGFHTDAHFSSDARIVSLIIVFMTIQLQFKFRWQNCNYEGIILMFSEKRYALESNPG